MTGDENYARLCALERSRVECAMPNETREALSLQRKNLIDYLLMKVQIFDWHAVADASMDLREIEAKLSMLDALNR